MVRWRRSPTLVEEYRRDVYDMAGEAQSMSRGRLVKARFPAEAPPNVMWLWLRIGNCRTCRSYRPIYSRHSPACLNPSVVPQAFLSRWSHRNDCPHWEAGTNFHQRRIARQPTSSRHDLSVRQFLGLAPGRPVEPVEILQNVGWNPWTGTQAHDQQQWFYTLAQFVDSGRPNVPGIYPYYDLDDPLPEIQDGEAPDAMGNEEMRHRA